MEKLTPSVLTKATLKRFIHLEEQDGNDYEWLQVDSIFLTVDEQHDLQQVQARLRNTRIHLMNEATLWARAYLNWQNDAQEPQEIFGCYTIASSWSFMRAVAKNIT